MINLAASSFDLHLFVHSAGSRRIFAGILGLRVGHVLEKWAYYGFTGDDDGAAAVPYALGGAEILRGR